MWSLIVAARPIAVIGDCCFSLSPNHPLNYVNCCWLSSDRFWIVWYCYCKKKNLFIAIWFHQMAKGYLIHFRCMLMVLAFLWFLTSTNVKYYHISSRLLLRRETPICFGKNKWRISSGYIGFRRLCTQIKLFYLKKTMMDHRILITKFGYRKIGSLLAGFNLQSLPRCAR